MIFIGDVHGKVRGFLNILKNEAAGKPAIQIGDLGLGFVNVPALDQNHRIFHGNHDAPNLFAAHPNNLGRFGVWNGVFFVAGAFSIDAQYRVPGVSWWADEQLSREEMDQAFDLYKKAKPRVVATHDAPRSLYPRLMMEVAARGPVYENSTAHLLEEMLDVHQPDWWIFGHWHKSIRFQVGNTNFVCLDELGLFELDVEAINAHPTETV